MPIYEAVCSEGHKFDKMLKIDERHITLECPECGATANTTISAVRCKLDGTNPDYPGAYFKWENDRKKRGGSKN